MENEQKVKRIYIYTYTKHCKHYFRVSAPAYNNNPIKPIIIVSISSNFVKLCAKLNRRYEELTGMNRGLYSQVFESQIYSFGG